MNTYRNNNGAYGESGPFKATSREALADEMMPTFEEWADQPGATQTVEQMRREFIAGLERVYDRDDMRGISMGIAAEMSDTDTAIMIGTNGKQGDKRVMVFEILRQTSGFKHGIPLKSIFETVVVASTNGDPIWMESDPEAFAEMMAAEGIEL